MAGDTPQEEATGAKANASTASIDAYHSGIVRIATIRENARPTLLAFASVELVTPTRPYPDTMPVDAKGIPQIYRAKAGGFDLAFRRVAMGAEEAVAWYRSLRVDPRLPVPRREEDRGKYDGTSIFTLPLTDEPSWPATGYPIADPSLFGTGDDLYPTPFLGAGAYPARVHRQLAASVPLFDRLIADEDACRWLRFRIHFDVMRHDELLGGAVLVIPDPDVRSVRTFMARSEDGAEHLIGEVRSREGRSLDNLTMTLFEERFGTIGIFKSFEVSDGVLMIVPAPDQLEHTGYVLSHRERGIVDQQKALPYLRTIGLNMDVVSRRVRVQTTEDRRKGTPETSHEIAEVTRATSSVVGLEEESVQARDAASRFYASAERRRAQRMAREQQLQWFDDRAKARAFIRDQIGRVRESVLIVDPYADGKDLFDFGHFVTRRDIKIRLLTSYASLNEKHGVTREEFRAGLLAALVTFNERGLPEPEVRLLKGGKNPPLHDRFLVTDNEVWLSGNSLNAIGERASVMLKLRDAQSVRERLEGHFDEAHPLNTGESS